MTQKEEQNPRVAAARAIHRIGSAGRTIDWVLESGSLAPLAAELTYGTLREYYALRVCVDQYLHKPLRDKDGVIYALLLVGAYQLLCLDKPHHASINETVAAARTLARPWASGLVNAVLRSLQRTLKANPKPPEQSVGKWVIAWCPGAQQHVQEVEFGHPQWLIDALGRDYPDDYSALLQANSGRAPMWLRINTLLTETDRATNALDEAGISWSAGWLPESIRLMHPMPLQALPHFDEGWWAAQDAGAQFAAHLVAPAEGMRVLDACCAPGGKLAHLLTLAPRASYIALDRSERRLGTTRSRLALYHQGIEPDLQMRCADAASTDWWDGVPFDRILIDAPCSGTGTIRRHPDIRITRTEADVAALCETQTALLRGLWPVLRPGGSLIYATCSILAQENEARVAAFLAEQEDAMIQPFELPVGYATRHGWQLLPTDSQTDAATDGFYYARLTKTRMTSGQAS